jgi:hypothetical protein
MISSNNYTENERGNLPEQAKKEWVNPELCLISKTSVQGNILTGDDGRGPSTGS